MSSKKNTKAPKKTQTWMRVVCLIFAAAIIVSLLLTVVLQIVYGF